MRVAWLKGVEDLGYIWYLTASVQVATDGAVWQLEQNIAGVTPVSRHVNCYLLEGAH